MYVLEKDRVTKLVTVADLHKQPIRMLAFSLISVLEMSLTALIKDTYPADTWKPLLGQNCIGVRPSSWTLVHMKGLTLHFKLEEMGIEKAE